MTNQSILVLGLARNCAPTLPGFFTWLNDVSREFEATAIIGENGSSDDTRRLIVDAALADLPVVLLDTAPMAAGADRLARMAIGREMLRIEAKLHPARIVVVVDLDSVFRQPPKVAGLRHAIELLDSAPELVAVTASSLPYYYDVLAYRDLNSDFDRLEQQIRSAQRNPFLYYWFMRTHVFSEQRRLTRLGPRRCSSAFNGLAVYRFDDCSRGSYLGGRPGVCEHVTFHESLSGEGRVAVIEELCVTTPPEHAPVGPISFYVQRLARRLDSH